MDDIAWRNQARPAESSWTRGWRVGFLIPVLGILFAAGSARAALYPQPPKDAAFTVTGYIEQAALDDPADVLSGGSVTVHGLRIVIPKNTRVLMPGRFLTWQQLWAKAPLPWGLGNAGGNGQTGLASADRDPSGRPPATTYEVTVQGNCIPNPNKHPKLDSDPGKCTNVAGLVAIAQHSLSLGQGVINYIDYATGTLHVGGKPGVPAPTDGLVQINDPAISGLSTGGRYSKGQSPDERFATDQDNPAIRSKTGYPMCIPRMAPSVAGVPLHGTVAGGNDDPECPQVNRPLDPNPDLPGGANSAPLGNFTLGLAANVSTVAVGPPVLATAHTTGQPDKQAPFEVGDAIEFSGTLHWDATGTLTGCTSTLPCSYISAYQIIANLGIYTSPGVNPAYLVVEDTLLGVGGTPVTFPNTVPQEATGRMKVVGFFTDPSRTVDVLAVQVHPCTGAENLVPLLQGVDGRVVPWGRFRDVEWTCPVAGAGGCGSPPTREWRVQYSGATPATAANGLKTLQYQIPISEYIFAENTVYGDPTLLVVPNNFQDFPFLLNGSGPLDGADGSGPIVGPLDPFPLSNSIPGLNPQVANTVTCTGQSAPVADAGGNHTVESQRLVTLQGTGSDSNIPNASPLHYTWVQTSGPPVSLTVQGGSTDAALLCTDVSPCPLPTSFTAPTVVPGAAPVNLTFQLTVTNSASPAMSAVDTAAITVTPPPVSNSDSVTITSATYRVRQSALKVSATSSASVNGCAAILTLTLDTGFTSTMSCTFGPGGATYTFSSKPVTQAQFATVKSSLGGKATVALTLN